MSRRGSNTLKPVVSLADTLDEENRETLASLEQKRTHSPAHRGSTGAASAPKRDFLFADAPTPRHGSIAGIGVGVTSPRDSRRRKFDPSDPTTWTSSHSTPVETRPRSSSEADRDGVPTITIDSRDSFDDNQKTDTSSVPIESEQAHPTSISNGSGSMAAALTGDLKNLQIREPGPIQAGSTSLPAEAHRSASPSDKHLSPKGKHGRSGSDLGEEDAHRRFSNQSASFSTVTDDSGEIHSQVSKDQEGDEDALEDSSDERLSRDDSDDGSPVAERGRKRKKHANIGEHAEGKNGPEGQDDTVKHGDAHAPPHSQKTKSMLDPIDIGSRTTSGKFSETKSIVHPHSNFDRGTSPAPPAAYGDDEADIQKAKALALRISPIDDKIVDRHVKMIIRGEWGKFQDHEAGETLYRHEPRLYLACSDLSHEASYALEWTIGTLLKDGDTILVISAIGDDTASQQKDLEEPSAEIRMESAKAAEEANETMESLTRQTTNQIETADPIKALKRENAPVSASHSRSRSGVRPSKKAEERLTAVEKLETEFLKNVRKTSLQVRCMIEVIHCRSPRHLIVNAIDELEPTLVVVGTRGQGTVRNVMMGSFSNYLVTKSSVPVMVARKRLKKPRHAKVSSQQIRMTNNLTPFGSSGKRKSLTQARID